MLTLIRGFRTLLDALARVLLLPVLSVALLGYGLAFLADGLVVFTGDGDPRLLWSRIGQWVNAEPTTVRLVVFGPVQLVFAGYIVSRWTRIRSRLHPTWVRWRERIPSVFGILGWVATAVMACILVPFVIQPTLVSPTLDRTAWKARAANLVDGTASRSVLGSVLALHRRYTGQIVPGQFSVPSEAMETRGLDSPMMSRWDGLLNTHTRDRHHFAQTKAFMYVESAGRQYAVSRTGCAGLMQFCVSTANRRPFRSIFGVGAVSACDCRTRSCAMDRTMRDALETDGDALTRYQATFPCDSTDARFHPPRAIEAGAAFTTELGEDVGDNLYLMYIGYNSGPAVAKRLYKRLGKNPNATLDDIRPHLAPVLSRWYGDRATSRANGLLDVHLPKLMRAYQHYR